MSSLVGQWLQAFGDLVFDQESQLPLFYSARKDRDHQPEFALLAINSHHRFAAWTQAGQQLPDAGHRHGRSVFTRTRELADDPTAQRGGFFFFLFSTTSRRRGRRDDVAAIWIPALGPYHRPPARSASLKISPSPPILVIVAVSAGAGSNDGSRSSNDSWEEVHPTYFEAMLCC